MHLVFTSPTQDQRIKGHHLLSFTINKCSYIFQNCQGLSRIFFNSLPLNAARIVLHDCKHFNDKDMQSIQKRCTLLEKFYLSGSTFLKNISSGFLGNALTFGRLKVLHFRDCPNLTSLNLQTPLLRLLKLEGRSTGTIQVRAQFSARIDAPTFKVSRQGLTSSDLKLLPDVPVKALDLMGPDIGNEDLALFPNKSLTRLSLCNCSKITLKGLYEVSFANLQKLDMNGLKFDYRDLFHPFYFVMYQPQRALLKGMPRLTELDFSGSIFGQKVEFETYTRDHVHDHLPLHQIKVLSLSKTNFNLLYLRYFKSLLVLHLDSHLTITDQDLIHLRAPLESLKLNKCKKLTGECLSYLARIDSLRKVDISGSPQISENAVKSLQKGRPNLLIFNE